MGMNYIFYTNELEGEFKKTFDQVELYADIHNISGENRNEKLMDFLDTLLEAQKNGDPINKIIGKDLEAFCKEFYADYTLKDRLIEFATSLYRLSWGLTIFGMIYLIAALGDGDFNLSTVSPYLSDFLIGFVEGTVILMLIHAFMKGKTFRFKKLTTITYAIALIIFIIVMSFVSTYFFGEIELNMPLSVQLGISAGYLVLYKTIQLVRRKQTKGSIFKSKAEGNLSMRKEFRSSMRRELPLEFIKRYEKINAKRIRKGKEALSKEAYMEKLRKENRMLKRFCLIVATIAIIGLSVFIYFFTKGDSPLDKLIFIVIIAIVEFPILYFFFFQVILGKDVRTTLFRELDELQMDIFEYANIQTK